MHVAERGVKDVRRKCPCHHFCALHCPSFISLTLFTSTLHSSDNPSIPYNSYLLLLTSEWYSIVWMDHMYQVKDIWIISSLGQLCNSCYKDPYMDACVDLSFLFPRVYTQEWIAERYSKSRFTFIRNGQTSLKWL